MVALSILYGATLLPILLLNYILINSSVGDGSQIVAASRWQESTRGTVMIGGVSALNGHRLFKAMRLHERLPDINTVILGSSTAMGISQSAVPEPFRIYNLASDSNPLLNVVGEADYIQKSFAGIKWLVIAMDWSIGSVYSTGSPPLINLSLDETLSKLGSEAMAVTAWTKFRDSISYPKIANLILVGKKIVHEDHKWTAFLDYFSLGGGREYVCPDLGRGRDFDSMFRGVCAGFRFDGSATFNHLPRVDAWPHFDIRSVRNPNVIYSRVLRNTNGIPNEVILDRLALIHRRAQENGGGVVFILPPLLPGMESEIGKDPVLATALARTKSVLAVWASRNELVLLDAGASERFGCSAHEFIDGHHAVETCYQKIFRQHLTRTGSGRPS